MLTLTECVDLSGLANDEVEIIAQHQQVPEIVAAELGYQLLQSPKGIYQLHCLFLDALEQAKLRRDNARARRINRIYTGFCMTYPKPRTV